MLAVSLVLPALIKPRPLSNLSPVTTNSCANSGSSLVKKALKKNLYNNLLVPQALDGSLEII